MDATIVKTPKFNFDDELIKILNYRVPPRSKLTKELQLLANNIQKHIHSRVESKQKVSLQCLNLLISVMYYNALLSVSTKYPYLTIEIDTRNIESFLQKSSLKDKMQYSLTTQEEDNSDLHKYLDSTLSLDYDEIFSKAERVIDDIYYIIKDFKQKIIKNGKTYSAKIRSHKSKSLKQITRKKAKKTISMKRRKTTKSMEQSKSAQNISALMKLRNTKKKYATVGGKSPNSEYFDDMALFANKPNYDTFVLLNIIAPFSLFTDSLTPHYKSASKIGGGLPLITSVIMVYLLLISLQHSDAIRGIKKKRNNFSRNRIRGRGFKDIDIEKLQQNWGFLQEPGNFLARNIVPRSEDITDTFQNAAIFGGIGSAIVLGSIVYSLPISITIGMAGISTPLSGFLIYGGASVLSSATFFSLGYGVYHEDGKWVKEKEEMERLIDEMKKLFDEEAIKKEKALTEERKIIENLMTNWDKSDYIHSLSWYITSITYHNPQKQEDVKFLENPFKEDDYSQNHTLWNIGNYIKNGSKFNDTNEYDILFKSTLFNDYQKEFLKNYLFIHNIINVLRLTSIFGVIFILSYNSYLFLASQKRYITSPDSSLSSGSSASSESSWPSSASPDSSLSSGSSASSESSWPSASSISSTRSNGYDDIIVSTMNQTFITKLMLIRRNYEETITIFNNALTESTNYTTIEGIVGKLNEIKTSLDDDLNKVLCVLLLLEYQNQLNVTNKLLLQETDDEILLDFVNREITRLTVRPAEVLVDLPITETHPIDENDSIVTSTFEAAARIFDTPEDNSIDDKAESKIISSETKTTSENISNKSSPSEESSTTNPPIIAESK